MKKLLISLIVAITAVFGCLYVAACDNGVYYNVEVKNEGYYLSEPLKDKYKAGEEVEIKIGIVYDADTYVYVNDKRIYATAGGDYNIYKFTMPEENVEILITSNAWHGVEICDFEDAFIFLKIYSKENIIKIKCEKGYIGVRPDSLAQVAYTTDKTDVENVFEIFNHKLKPNARDDKDGGYYIKYTFYSDKGLAFELPISNGFAQMITFSTCYYFEIVDFSVPQINNPDIQCSKFNLGSCKVYSDEELKNPTGKHAYLSDIEFDERDESIDGKMPVAYIDTGYGTLKVIDDKTFEYKDKIYKVVGNKDFSTIIGT